MSDIATIIIVDDEEELRENLCDLLEFQGYHVVSFASGEDALAQYEQVQPDLVLLDIQLPGIDGLNVLRKIRQKLSKEQLPVAMVSASSIRSILAEAEENGANMTILKPYSLPDMLNAVNTMLGEKAIRDE